MEVGPICLRITKMQNQLKVCSYSGCSTNDLFTIHVLISKEKCGSLYSGTDEMSKSHPVTIFLQQKKL